MAGKHQGAVLEQQCQLRMRWAPRCQWVRRSLARWECTQRRLPGWWMRSRSQRDMARQPRHPWDNKSHAHMACTRSHPSHSGRTAQGTAHTTPTLMMRQTSQASMAEAQTSPQSMTSLQGTRCTGRESSGSHRHQATHRAPSGWRAYHLGKAEEHSSPRGRGTQVCMASTMCYQQLERRCQARMAGKLRGALLVQQYQLRMQ